MATSKRNAPMAAMGSYSSILPFQAIGIEAVVLTEENRADVPRLMARYANDGYAILFLEESVYAEFQLDADETNEKTDLSVIPVPNQTGSAGIGVDSIRRSVERAVGMDIFNVQ